MTEMTEQEFETLSDLAIQIENKHQDGADFIEDRLPRGWQFRHFCCEETDDDLERKELEVELEIRDTSWAKDHKIFTFACSNIGYRIESHIVIGAPSFDDLKKFLEECLE